MKMILNNLKIFYLFIIIFLFYSLAQAGIEDKNTISIKTIENPLELDEETIKAGKKLWRKTGCYSCHGGNAEGGVGPNLQDDIWVYKPSDAMLFKTIAKGRKGTNMVGWEKELNSDEIWKIIIFIRSLYTGDKSKIIW